MADRRSPLTKPDVFKAARKRHKAAQARRDALARLRAGESVTVSAYPYNGKLPRKVRVRPFTKGEPEPGQYVLALHNRRLRVLYFYDKDGLGVGDSFRGHGVHPPFKDIFGVVEQDPFR